MIRTSRSMLVAVAVTAVVACTTAPTDRNIADSALDGTWQGTIENEAQSDILRLRLTIDGDTASVWTDHDGSWVEVDHGFRVSRSMGSAVIHATFPSPDAATEEAGANVMTWAIIATPRSPTELLVVSSWVENSGDMRKDPEIFRYSSHIAGVLYRESPGH